MNKGSLFLLGAGLLIIIANFLLNKSWQGWILGGACIVFGFITMGRKS